MNVEVIFLLDEFFKRFEIFVEGDDDDEKFNFVNLNIKMINIVLKIIVFFKLLLGNV